MGECLGCAYVQRATFIQGQHYSVLSVLMSDGIVSLDIFKGLVNKDHFRMRNWYVGDCLILSHTYI